MDVKKLMVSFCIEDSFFYKGKKRGRHVPPLSSNNAFRMTKTKNDIYTRGKNTTTHSHRPVRRAARPTKKLPLFSPSWWCVVPFAGRRRRGPDEHFFSSRLLLRFFFDDDDDSDAMKWRPRRRHSRRPKAPRDACHYQHTTRTTRDAHYDASWRVGAFWYTNDMRPFFVKKKQHRNVFNNNEREKKRAGTTTQKPSSLNVCN